MNRFRTSPWWPIGFGFELTAKRSRRCCTPSHRPLPDLAQSLVVLWVGRIQDFCATPYHALSICGRQSISHSAGATMRACGDERSHSPATSATVKETMLVKALYRRDLRLSASGMFTLAWEDEACVIEMDCANTMRLRTVIKRGGLGFRGQSTQSTFRASRGRAAMHDRSRTMCEQYSRSHAERRGPTNTCASRPAIH